jgi:asparagine synthase (glutamine-hydrolysing)
MCGIAGIVNFTAENVHQDVVKNMMRVLRHRGPDDDGMFVDRYIALGHVRLSIVDLEGSKQPLSNENGTVWVTFNGEIYNFIGLRKNLISKGHVFKTRGDTEVLVHLYEEYGKKLVQFLQGMFAFSIWDKRKQELLIVRDRMGIKPLYYCQQGENFIFASEQKAILQHPGYNTQLDPEALWQYLTYRSVPAPRTFLKGISKLKAGHLMILNVNGITEESYWDIPLIRESDKTYCYDKEIKKYVDQTESLLLESVDSHLISDVPLGAFLSGGVDSSLIVAMMHKLSDCPVKTYSVGFNNFPTSELPFARIVAELFQTDHHELILEEEHFADNFEKVTWMRDSPLSEPGDVPLYLLAKIANKNVKVLLSGEGSDELFGGYPKYAFDSFAPAVDAFPRRMIHLIGEQMPPVFRRIELALKSLCEKEPANRWAQWFSPFTQEEKMRLTLSPNSWKNPTQEYAEHAKTYGSLDAMLYTDCKLWLPDNLLDRGDKMTMAASIEGRVPYLDHKFVEFAFGISQKLKVRRFCGKWLVKEVAKRYLPRKIIGRRKNGFDVPLAQWFRGKLRNMCYDRICQRDSLLSQLLTRKELEKVLDDHCSCRKNNFLKIWTLLALAIWYDLFCSDTVISRREIR